MADMPDHRITWHLDNWAEWMRPQRSDYGDCYDSNTSCFSTGNSRTFEAMVAEADMRCAMAVQAIIESLPPIESCAVHNRHMEAVFRFHRATMDGAYARARISVREGLKRRGIE